MKDSSIPRCLDDADLEPCTCEGWGAAVADKDDDWGKTQERMARAIISELRDDLEDLLRGLKAGTLDYITALQALKILL